jgi:SNF2 family DNA or RNA helicase
VENRLDDLYGLLQLVDGEVLGPLWRFNLDYLEQDSRGKVTGYRNLGVLRRTIAPVVLRRRKEDVLSQLPALTEQTRYVALSEEQKELEESYRSTAARLVRIAEKRPLSPAEQKRLQAALLKARQACDAAVLCDPESAERSPAKIEELLVLVGEIAQQGTSKVLVFSEWTEMLKLAGARLDAMGVGWSFLHGGVPTAQRGALLDDWRTDANKPVLLSTDAGGVGLNLQSASYVVHLDLPWNPAKVDQRVSRAHRLGQTRGVLVTYLCAETGIERELEGTLKSKREVRSAALDQDSEVDELEAARLGVVSVLEVDEKKRAREERESLDRAHQRLRLGKIVLDAGYPDDAIRAAQEAIQAAATALGEDAEVLPPGANAAAALTRAEEWIDRTDRATAKRR